MHLIWRLVSSGWRHCQTGHEFCSGAFGICGVCRWDKCAEDGLQHKPGPQGCLFVVYDNYRHPSTYGISL
ncbi:hypothetical protein FKM82_017709 [Ascaphus truei]